MIIAIIPALFQSPRVLLVRIASDGRPPAHRRSRRAAARAAEARAHHSISGQFDISKTVTLTGTIAKLDWINPHAYLQLRVKGANGTAPTWALSTIPIAMMRKAGISKEALGGKPGEAVTVKAHPALNGRPVGWIVRITYSDGHYYALFE